ncbi:MAG: DNA primase [Pseudomonadota bacterium]|nr:DNA primase [Pseudomonadota bacterium]
MAGPIPQSFIDELLSRVDIVELIDNRVPLKKAGRDFSACCPFHNEKTPSFTVSPSKQFYHCFGCGAHGSALGFLMEFDKLEFPDAVRQLAEQVGMEIPANAQEPHAQPGHAELRALMDEVKDYYRQALKQSSTAIDYLKSRGLSGRTAAQYAIGYAPAGWNNLTERFGRDRERQKQLLAGGLLIQSDKQPNRRYDRFRNRIMFPIRDRRGRTLGFGGRAIGDDSPKYLNSPETPLFHKGRELYGLHEAKQAHQQLTQLLIVEGYMDVLMLAEHGITHAVATLGTATTGEHIRQLFRVAPELIFCFDGDRAGREAAWRALEQTLPFMRDGHRAGFLFLPEGHDPDSLIRERGRSGFEQLVGHPIPLSEFLVKRLSETIDITHVDGRAALVEAAKPYIQKIPPGAFRLLMEEQLADFARVKSEKLSILMGKSEDQRPRGRPGRPRSRTRMTPVRKLIALLLNDMTLALGVKEVDQLRDVNIEGTELLADIIELVQQNPHLRTGALLEHWRGHPAGPHLAKLAGVSMELGGEDLTREFEELLSWLRQRQPGQRLESLLEKAQETDLSAHEREELRRLLAQRQN